jgi:hypothetical protein
VHLAFVTRSLEPIVTDETASAETRAEAAMLMKQLYLATKTPPDFWLKKS